jgi:hypothetical protein
MLERRGQLLRRAEDRVVGPAPSSIGDRSANFDQHHRISLRKRTDARSNFGRGRHNHPVV